MKHSPSFTWIKSSNSEKNSIKCAIDDHFMLRAPVPLVFFYENNIESTTLIKAIRSALTAHPLFAGRLLMKKHHLYIQCNNAGARFTQALSQQSLPQTLNHLSDANRARLVDAIQPKRAFKPDEPVLTIKLTQFTDGGCAIGFCWSHCVGDMATFMAFLHQASQNVPQEKFKIKKTILDRPAYLQSHIEENFQEQDFSDKLDILHLSKLNILKLIPTFIKQALSKKGVYFYFTENEMENIRQHYKEKIKKPLSQHDALCTHINTVLQTASQKYAPKHLCVVVNFRDKIGLPNDLAGNFLGSVMLPCQNKGDELAAQIRHGINHFQPEHFNYFAKQKYVNQLGGMRSIKQIIPTALLPKNRSFLISSWRNFGVYDIDYGTEKPLLVLACGKSPLPWLSFVIEGVKGKGLLMGASFPSKIARKLQQSHIQSLLHRYRATDDSLPEAIQEASWIL